MEGDDAPRPRRSIEAHAALSRSKLCVSSLRSEIGRPSARRAAGARALEGMAPMHTQSSGSRGGGGSRLERAIVLELLSDDGERSRSIAELEVELGAAAGELTAVLSDLSEVGVVAGSEGRVWASAATRRLDELELIGI